MKVHLLVVEICPQWREEPLMNMAGDARSEGSSKCDIDLLSNLLI